VYIHALVRDANREKMSKTKGNVLDPIEIVKQYGTDAVRFTLASMASPGTDIAFNVARTEGYRAFANKIWNAARFIFMNVDRAAEIGITVDPAVLGGMPTASEDAPLEARWIVAELHATAAKVNQALEAYRYDDAANLIYQFFWGSFCDWYLEIVKLRLDFSETADKAQTTAALTTFVSVFEVALRLFSPFMPFITEEIWHALYDGKPPAKSIALASFPQANGKFAILMGDASLYTLISCSGGAVLEMHVIEKIVTALRSLRKDAGVPDKEIVDSRIYCSETDGSLALGYIAQRSNKDLCNYLAKVVLEVVTGEAPLQGLVRQETGFAVEVLYEKAIDISAERERLTKDIAKYEKGLAAAERQLGNEGFLAKAPAHIVEGLKKQEAETRLLLEKARAALDALPPN